MRTTGRIGWAGATAAALGVNALVISLLSMEHRRERTPRSRTAEPVLYLDIEPRASLPTDRSPRPSRSSGHTPSPVERPLAIPPTSSNETKVLGAAVAAVAPVEEGWRVTTGAGRLNDSLASCDAPHRLSVEGRRRCDDRWMRLGQDVRSIAGSGDAERDTVFARQGARRLAAWEAKRAEPPPGDPPCESPNPVAGCEGVNISVELFSTRDGVLPNLRKRRQ